MLAHGVSDSAPVLFLLAGVVVLLYVGVICILSGAVFLCVCTYCISPSSICTWCISIKLALFKKKIMLAH
jgi:hypothetical protein